MCDDDAYDCLSGCFVPRAIQPTPTRGNPKQRPVRQRLNRFVYTGNERRRRLTLAL